MDISYFHHGKEYKVEIPPLWGKRIISAVQFESGFGLLMYDCVFHEEVEIHFSGGVVHPLKFMYSQEGHFKVRSENNESFSMMEKYHSAILSSQGENGHIFRFPSGVRIRGDNILDINLFFIRYLVVIMWNITGN